MRKLLVPVYASVAFAGLTCAAAQTPTPTPLEWAQVETIEANIRPGPAVWRVSRGESEVWILGHVGPIPKGLDWNKDYVAELLDGARALVLPPRANVGLLGGAWLLINYGGRLSLPRGQALEASLNEDVRARFIALRTNLGRDEDRYRTDTPVRAALRLMTDANSKMGLSNNPAGTISDIARDKDVPRRPVLDDNASDLIRDVLTLPLDRQRICFARAVDEIAYLSTHAEAAARAWAVGDIRTIKANLSDGDGTLGCMSAAVSSVSQMRERAVSGYVGAVDAALAQKGKTVVLIGMAELLRKDGVLARLEAKGLSIEGPAE